jgi:SPP1 gp7 family putative phage head morphogenesis protein
MIARTESGEAANAGRQVVMRANGVKRIEWVTAHDDRVRDSHAAIDGDVIDMGERFDNGLRYPQDPEGPPEEVINCRCVAAPVIVEGQEV